MSGHGAARIGVDPAADLEREDDEGETPSATLLALEVRLLRADWPSRPSRLLDTQRRSEMVNPVLIVTAAKTAYDLKKSMDQPKPEADPKHAEQDRSFWIPPGSDSQPELGDTRFWVQSHSSNQKSGYELRDAPVSRDGDEDGALLYGWCGVQDGKAITAHGMVRIDELKEDGSMRVRELRGRELAESLEKSGFAMRDPERGKYRTALERLDGPSNRENQGDKDGNDQYSEYNQYNNLSPRQVPKG